MWPLACGRTAAKAALPIKSGCIRNGTDEGAVRYAVNNNKGVLALTIYAETLVILEAILGQFYLAVLLAGLISAYLSDRDQSSPPG